MFLQLELYFWVILFGLGFLVGVIIFVPLILHKINCVKALHRLRDGEGVDVYTQFLFVKIHEFVYKQPRGV